MRLTRRQALAASGAALVVPGAALAAGTREDTEQRYEAALTAALRLEQTAVVALEAIANSGFVADATAALLNELIEDDREHADQLTEALEDRGAEPPIPPRRADIDGLAAVRSDAAAARFAIALEEETIAAYSAAVLDFIDDPTVLRTVAGAMGTDGQHLVVLRQLAGLEPVPGAFERGMRG
jgi:rubrerythrin